LTNSNAEQRKPATLDDVVGQLQKHQETLEQILLWTKVGEMEKVKKVLETTLDSPQKKIVYHLSDGKSTKEIVEASKVSAGSVSGYWKAWNKLGLMKVKKVMGGDRSVRIFELEDFGIDVPKAALKQEPAVQSSEQVAATSSEAPIGGEKQ
jgi:hypothetical protein